MSNLYPLQKDDKTNKPPIPIKLRDGTIIHLPASQLYKAGYLAVHKYYDPDKEEFSNGEWVIVEPSTMLLVHGRNWWIYPSRKDAKSEALRVCANISRDELMNANTSPKAKEVRGKLRSIQKPYFMAMHWGNSIARDIAALSRPTLHHCGRTDINDNIRQYNDQYGATYGRLDLIPLIELSPNEDFSTIHVLSEGKRLATFNYLPYASRMQSSPRHPLYKLTFTDFDRTTVVSKSSFDSQLLEIYEREYQIALKQSKTKQTPSKGTIKSTIESHYNAEDNQ